MSTPIYRRGNDLKVDITIMDGTTVVAPDLVPVTVLLWTSRKADAVRCGWDGSEWFGGASKNGDVMHVVVDAPNTWSEGELHGEAILHYPDSEMPDKTNDKTVMIELEVGSDTTTITGTTSHVCYGLSAYDLAVQQGYVGTLAEWLASLKGETGATGATGPQGPAGKDGADGKDGSVIYPSFDISSDGHLMCLVPTTEADINAEIKDGHLILTVA